ncbi:MAG TPA: 3-ketoacyl-ACP reductase [Fibrobacteres bacterium]|jgi:3-oxoacyl-[acyl-carrier protein] reductase|nr:3-ketoacyl-ACP reductase [Fibrobacterota bacterium]
MNVLITGGSRGIGRAMVLRIVQAGHGCAFTYAVNQIAAEETIRLAKQINPQATVRAYALDVKRSDMVEKVIDAILRDFDNITAVVNNAAVVRNNAAALMSNEEWDEVIAANLTGPFYVIRGFLMHFLSNRKGKIINISSLAQDGCSGQINYAASKAGLIGLTQTLAKEYGAKGITANVVTVGYVPTDMTKDHLSESLHNFWLQHCPLKKAGCAEDIANVVNFLISEEANFINGEVIRVSGGLTYAP